MQLTDLKFVTIETFVIQFVLLLIVLFVLNKFVFQPYLAYLDELEEKTILETAEKEAKDIVEASKVEIKQQELAMMSSMKSKVIDLTLRLNEKLFHNEKVSKDFLEKNIDSI